MSRRYKLPDNKKRIPSRRTTTTKILVKKGIRKSPRKMNNDERVAKLLAEHYQKGREEMLKDIKQSIHNMIDYRGGMGNRIDAFDIQDFLDGNMVYEEQLNDADRGN